MGGVRRLSLRVHVCLCVPVYVRACPRVSMCVTVCAHVVCPWMPMCVPVCACVRILFQAGFENNTFHLLWLPPFWSPVFIK